MTTYLQADINTYKALQTFETVQQMNDSLRVAFNNFKTVITKNAMRVLFHISKYSVKYIGVSFLCKRKIADALDIDIRTVRRAIRQLEEFQLVKSYRMKRVKGDKREASSAIVIQPLISVLAVCPTIKTENKPKDINNTNDTEKSDFDKKEATKQAEKNAQAHKLKQGLVIKLPVTLQQALAPFFSAEQLYTLSGIVFKAKASIDKSIRIEEHENDYYNSILSVINAFKRGKVKNLESLLSHAIKSTTRKIWLQQGLCKGFGL